MFRYSIASLVLIIALLFLVSPVLRKGATATWTSWRATSASISQSDASTLQKNDRAKSDPQVLAYLALITKDKVDAARFASAAVDNDTDLTWIYAPLILQQRIAAEKSWAERLVDWDPSNAYALAVSGSFDCNQQLSAGAEFADPECAAAMKKVFAAVRYDDYLPRRIRLQQDILQRYGVGSPESTALMLAQYPLVVEDWMRYGKELASSSSEQDWWSAFLFAQKVSAAATTDLERYAAADVMAHAARRLVPALNAEGNSREALLVANASAAAGQQISTVHRGTFEMLGTAPVVQLMTVLLAAGALALVIVGILALVVRAKQRPSTWLRPVAVVGLAISSTAVIGLYLGYLPYYELFRRFALGHAVTPQQLIDLGSIYFVPGMVSHFVPEYVLRVWTWYGVVGLGLVLLIAIAVRNRPKIGVMN